MKHYIKTIYTYNISLSILYLYLETFYITIFEIFKVLLKTFKTKSITLNRTMLLLNVTSH